LRVKEAGLKISSLFTSAGKGALAIDIGSVAIKYVKFEGGRVVDYGVKEIAEIFDIPSILKDLTKDYSPGQVYSFVSGPAVSIRQAPFPRMGSKELNDAILLRLDKYSPFTLDESILDYTVISDIREGGNIRDNVMVVAARRDVVSEHIATFKKAGLEPTAISVVPFALAASARRYARLKEDEVVCLIDIGAQFTNIIFIRNQKLDLTRTITIAGNALTEAMTVTLTTDEGELALNITDAEEIKKQYGLPKPDSNEKLPNGISIRHLATLQEPILARMLAEINRSIDYYRREFTVARIDRILLCGGGSLLKNIKDYMETNIGIPTEMFDPFRSHNLYRRDRPFTEGLGMRLIGALGLLYDSGAVNLLPQELKSLRVRRSDGKRVAALAIVVIPALIVINVILALQTGVKRRDIEKYQRRLKALELVHAEYYDIQDDISSLQSKQNSLQGVVGSESNTIPLLRQLSYVVPPNIQLKTFSSIKEKGIKITGLVSDQPFLVDLDLSQFMLKLDAAPYFRNVKLVNKNRTVFQGETVLDFEISCDAE
jgi:type IV pilus assembly protein PilM